QTGQPSKTLLLPHVVRDSGMRPNVESFWAPIYCRLARSIPISSRHKKFAPQSSTITKRLLQPSTPLLCRQHLNRAKNTTRLPRESVHLWPACLLAVWQACISVHLLTQTNWFTASAPSLKPRQEQQNEIRIAKL